MLLFMTCKHIFAEFMLKCSSCVQSSSERTLIWCKERAKYCFCFWIPATWTADTMLLLRWKNLKLQRWFSELRATHSWKLYLWAKGQLGMRFTPIWSHARVPQSHLFGFIANKQKGDTESELKCSCSEVRI